MSAVVVFFSRSGENLINGKPVKISIGNTELLAQKIAERLNCQRIQLEEMDRYPEEYKNTVDRAAYEKQENKRIAYHPVAIDRLKIDTLFLGYPNWWGSYPRIIATFLEDFETDGLAIYPFCTHEGSAFGSSLNELKEQCPNATIHCGLPVRGSRVDRSDIAIENWLLMDK
ncbi:flavodoxin family protein [Enterococcus sp. DIV0876]|uniref:flavodoxin family protein n=1 Tax=Enterococcus sp. DIV0876 TaxID=2774633 RepID=UPI003D2FAE8D